MRRVFLLVLDSFGMGALPDAHLYGDAGSNTLRTVSAHPAFHAPNLRRLGLFHIPGAPKAPTGRAAGAYGKMAERAAGKDTTTGHWELAGLVLQQPFPTYPQGFPPEVIEAFERRCGVQVLCNRPSSGTAVLLEYGREHMQSGKPIVYTSADSVFQIAAHEQTFGRERLYACCRIARELLVGPHGVGRVIARPFVGQYPNFVRTPYRHDYSLQPPAPTLLDHLQAAGRQVISVGKISDIFAGRGIDESHPTRSNDDGMQKTLALAGRDFHGLCFVNLVDFDSAYGHRNDIAGYARALSAFDVCLGQLLARLGQEDVLILTADHGCDPGFAGTDHTREYVPLLVWGAGVRAGTQLGVRGSFADVGQTVAQLLGAQPLAAGQSFAAQLR